MYYNMSHEQCNHQVDEMLQLAQQSESQDQDETMEIKNDACNFLYKVINNKRNKSWNFHL